MRSYLSLFLIAIAGVLLVLSPWQTFRFPAGTRGPLALWLVTLKCFAIPACLVLLGLTRSIVVKFCALGWGLWVMFLSFWLAVQMNHWIPEVTTYGQALLGVVAVLSLATVTFTAIELGNKRRKPVAPQ